MDSSLRHSWGLWPCQHFDFDPAKSFLGFLTLELKIINLCCLTLLGICYNTWELTFYLIEIIMTLMTKRIQWIIHKNPNSIILSKSIEQLCDFGVENTSQTRHTKANWTSSKILLKSAHQSIPFPQVYKNMSSSYSPYSSTVNVCFSITVATTHLKTFPGEIQEATHVFTSLIWWTAKLCMCEKVPK